MDTNNKSSAKSITIILIVVILVVVGAIYYMMSRGSSAPASQGNNTAQTSGNQPVTTATPLTGNLYTSSADGFSAGFPGTPNVTNTTFDSPSAGTIPLTEYKDVTNVSTDAYYAVYVYHYPASYQFASDYVGEALTSFLSVVNSKYPGSVIASKTPTQFSGNPSLSAIISVPHASGAANDYLLITTKGQNAYIISTYGTSQEDFNTFTSSFVFN